MVTLNHYLLVSGLLFAIGLTGVIVRRNIITIYMCLEMMLSAANLTLVAFSRFHIVPDGLPNAGLPDYNAQALVFFTITVAAAEVAVGLAIIVALFRAKQSVNVGAVEKMKD
jgi:NADH-quinone oxidoreductase subunit K